MYLNLFSEICRLNSETYFKGAIRYYMGQSDQAEEKPTFRCSECDEGWSHQARKITRITEKDDIDGKNWTVTVVWRENNEVRFFPRRLTKMK